MPLTLRIDPELETVFTTSEGVVTFDDVRAAQNQLLSDPAFEPSFHHLFDLRGASDLAVSYAEMWALVEHAPFGKGARRAFVANHDSIFGTLRMAQTLLDNPPSEIRVFRAISEARSWLGLD